MAARVTTPGGSGFADPAPADRVTTLTLSTTPRDEELDISLLLLLSQPLRSMVSL